MEEALTLCMLGSFHDFVVSAEYFKIKIFRKVFQNTFRVLNGSDPNPDPKQFSKVISR